MKPGPNLTKMRHLLEMARRGEPGERDVARKILDQMLAAHGLTDQDVDPETRDTVAFRFCSKMERNLLLQIWAQVTGIYAEIKTWSYENASGGKNNRVIGLECTSTERIEVERLFRFYRRELKRELGTFWTAFLASRDLLAPAGDPQPLTQEEMDEMRRASRMARNMDPRTPRKQLEAK